MKLRDKLLEILPSLLPEQEYQAIKGKELIRRVREVLGADYSDHTLRSQFSFLVLDEDSCLARVENGQGYYLRNKESEPSLHSIFESSDSPEADDPYRKALALAVRLYDTAGYGIFVYPVEEEESWEHPDFIAVQWPAGYWENGAYIFDTSEEPPTPSYCAICVAVADSVEDCRKAFFRTLACGAWAQQSELLLLGNDELPEEELSELAAQYGVGVKALGIDSELLDTLGGADLIFKAEISEARALLGEVAQHQIAAARIKKLRLPREEARPDVAALIAWVENCLAKGKLESYELRVAVN